MSNSFKQSQDPRHSNKSECDPRRVGLNSRPVPLTFTGFPHGPEHCRIDLMTALHKVPEKLRVPLFLKHVEGFSYNEISSIMKIGTSAAKMRVKRGRDQLVEHLSEKKHTIRKSREP